MTFAINGVSLKDKSINLDLSGLSFDSLKDLIKMATKKAGVKYSSGIKIFTKEGVNISGEDDLMLLKEGDILYLALNGKAIPQY